MFPFSSSSWACSFCFHILNPFRIFPLPVFKTFLKHLLLSINLSSNVFIFNSLQYFYFLFHSSWCFLLCFQKSQLNYCYSANICLFPCPRFCFIYYWSLINLPISDVDCGKVTQLLYGSVTYMNGTTYLGSTVTYSCVKNYRLVGVAARQCLENGQWSDESPRCEGKSTVWYIYSYGLE